MTDELKEAARPLSTELLKSIDQGIAQINQYKKEQKDGDIKFRTKWREEKSKDSKRTQALLFLAVMALSLDLVQLHDFVTILNRIVGLFG